LLPPLFSAFLQRFTSAVCSLPFSALCFSILLQQFVPTPFQRFASAFCFSILLQQFASALFFSTLLFANHFLINMFSCRHPSFYPFT
jgi:uncharacterized membrane protein